ncbi:MAG: hypothetical protein AAGA81_24300 [Acidobacteriota bacterium]
MTGPRRRRWLLTAILLAGATATDVWPCSKADPRGLGPVWTGESFGYFGSAPPGLRRPLAPWLSAGSVVIYSTSGEQLLAEPYSAPELVEGRFFPRKILPDGSVWGSVRCDSSGATLEPLCGETLRVSARGDVLETLTEGTPWPFSQDLPTELRGGGRNGEDGPYRLLVQWPGREEPVVLTSPFTEKRSPYGPGWSTGRDGELAVMWFSDSRVAVVLFDSRGDEVWRREYPRSFDSRREEGAEATLDLAEGRMIVAPDGSLVIGAWGINPDCSPRHRSSFVVLDAQGGLRARVDGPQVEGMALSPEGRLAVRRGPFTQDLELFNLDGELIAELAQPSQWKEEEARLRAEAKRVTEESDPADWFRYFEFMPSAFSRVRGWVVETWPSAADVLPASLALRFAEDLCALEEERAPGVVLGAFLEERHFSRRLVALSGLSQCFEEPPAEIADFLEALLARKDGEAMYYLGKARERWPSLGSAAAPSKATKDEGP